MADLPAALRHPRVREAMPALALLALGLVVAAPVLGPGLPPGYDAPTYLFATHLSTASAAAGEGWIPSWNPWWYGGHDLFRLYPPGAFLAAAFLGLAAGGPVAGVKLLLLAGFAAAPPLVYLLARALGKGQGIAALAGGLFLANLAVLHDLALWGRVTTVVGLALLLALMVVVERALRGRDQGRAWPVAAALLASALVLTHHLTALAACSYLLLRAPALLRSLRAPALRGPAVAGAALGAVLTLWWVVPFLDGALAIGFQRDVPGGYAFTAERFLALLLEPATAGTLAYPTFVGLPLMAAAAAGLVVALADRERLLPALLAGWGLVALAPAVGGLPLPAYGQLDVARFFLYAAVPASLLAASGLAWLLEAIRAPLPARLRAPATALALLLLLAPTVQAASHVEVRPLEVSADQRAVFRFLAAEEDARVYAAGYRTWDAYLFPVEARTPIIHGWFHESAPRWRDLQELDRIKNGLAPPDGDRWVALLRAHGTTHVVVTEELGAAEGTRVRALADARPDLALAFEAGPTRVYALAPAGPAGGMSRA